MDTHNDISTIAKIKCAKPSSGEAVWETQTISYPNRIACRLVIYRFSPLLSEVNSNSIGKQNVICLLTNITVNLQQEKEPG